MRYRLTELLDARLHVGDEDLPVTGAWIDPDGGRLQYLGVDIGGWLSERTALVAAGLVSWDGRRWTADITREEIEAAALDGPGAGAFDLASLPPVITGPFGNTISPLMIAVGLRAEALEEAPPHPPEATEPEQAPLTATDRTRRLETWEELHGAPVFARDGEIGPVSDILFDDRAWEPAEIVVLDRAGPAHVPWPLVRRRVEAGGHIVLSADRADILGAERA